MDVTNNFVLRVRQESLTISGHGSIWGELWCPFGPDQNFPEARWSDLVVAVLGWWLASSVTLVDGRRRKATIHFMDGPFLVNVFAKRMDTWEAELVTSRAAGEQVPHRVEFAPEPFIESLVQAAGSVLEECAKNHWTNADVDSLVLQRERLIHFRAKNRGRRGS